MNATLARLSVLLLAGATVLAVTPPLRAHDSRSESVQPLMKQAISDAPGKNVLIATVTLAPGQSAAPHLHPGSIFAYVLEGSVTSQLEGQSPHTYTQGQTWYEAPRVHHLVTRNASATQPAKLLVWAVVGDGDPIKLPLPQGDKAGGSKTPSP
ncbi:MAG TPA: cupin domain-containing protein [Dyella sp.]|uniref:cupin domain-containing protein n=1 Tax=Dyella sp. TaxID=1869338 RepID=UPI002D76D67E|nr:cupin domain-containing protein [Dyella sp.]HET6553140.1 cupin domain-containing protein [Dyella sp.]